MIGKYIAICLLCVVGAGSRSSVSQVQKSDSPTAPATAGASPRIFALKDGDSSFLYINAAANASPHRLTARKSGWEADGVLSPGGNVVAYSVADRPEAKSEVWISRIDGSHAHRVSAADEDAIMPAFAANDHTLLYVKSRFHGHYSPIARPRRHEFDVVKVMVDADGPIAGAVPVELTQQGFFDLLSLSVSPDGERFLLSTSGYPIGSLIEEFEIAKPLQIKRIFQPHVPAQPSTGAAFGGAVYTPDGMNIVFTAASEGEGGRFNYNIYQMSGVTGGSLVALTHRTGMIDELSVASDGTVFFSSDGQWHSLDTHTGALKQN